MQVLALCFLFLECAYLVQCGNFLFVFPFPSKSHHIMSQELIKVLVKRGHHATLITPYHINEKLPNYTEVLLEEILEWKESKCKVFFRCVCSFINKILGSMKKITNFNSSKLEMFMSVFQGGAVSRITLQNPSVQALLKSNKTFDAVLLNPLLTEALFGFSYHYNAPTIVVNTQGSAPTVDEMIGNSRPFAYVPNPYMALTDEMSFLERTKNTLLVLFLHIFRTLIWIPLQNGILHEHFPNAPPLWDLIHNVSLMLLNGQFSVIETPRPYLPNMIPVGGFHIQPQTLPANLKKLLDEAAQGVVLFSLGSNVESADLPKDKLDAILNSFAKFPQIFIWKFENDILEVPNNVKIAKWLPQRAVLSESSCEELIVSKYYCLQIIPMLKLL